MVTDMVFGFLAGLAGGSVVGFLKSANVRIERASYNVDPVQAMAFAAYCDAYRLKSITKRDFYQYSREVGYSANQAKAGYHNFRSFISGEQSAVLRIADSLDVVLSEASGTEPSDSNPGTLKDVKSAYQAHMYKQGYGAQESEKIFNSLRPVPTFSILLEWLAKEAFEPKFIKKFMLDDKYPEIWSKLMAALNVPANEAKNYWVAHWVHPAPGQIGEMYNRYRDDRIDYSESDIADAGTTFEKLKMSKEDFTDALELQEIAPYWHDKIIASSFMPLTLTSLQQGYVYGLKPDSWFLGRLRDYRYSKGNAEFILDIWRRKYPYGSKAPLTQNITLRYLRGETTMEDAKEELESKKVPSDAAQFILDIITDKRNFEIEAKEITGIAKKYRKQAMTRTELIALATSAGVDSTRVERVADIVAAEKEGLLTRLKIRDVKAGVKNKNLTIAEAKEILQSIRIDDSDIAWLIQIYTPKEDIPIA